MRLVKDSAGITTIGQESGRIVSVSGVGGTGQTLCESNKV